ncbi:hypothetical protein [Paraburkholderia sp. MM6662-R1]|uniref:hypothetical protein n=1 Tax=Paraburkholderia sp. MM6662-R1 TaxID=2991066 RepID=UPI003D216361
MFTIGTMTPSGNFDWFGECETLEDVRSKAGAMRQVHWLRGDMLEMEHLESDTQAVVLDLSGTVVYVATTDNGFDD